MIPEAYKSFINDIIIKTDNKEITWIEEAEDTYSIKTKNATVTIGYEIDDDILQAYYYFNYKNVDNRKSAGFRVTSEERDYKVMGDLFVTAAASANNIDEELDEFLKDL